MKNPIKSALSFFARANEDLASLRRDIADTKQALEALEHVGLPYDAALDKLNAYIDAIDGSVNLASFVQRGAMPHIGIAGNLGPLEIAVKLCGKEAVRANLVAGLAAEVAARPDGLSDAEFADKRAELTRRLHDLETREHAFILDAESAGMACTRRPDMSLIIALDVK
jgi:hypothetical protein